MRILGVDPGIQVTGYGIIELSHKSRNTDYGPMDLIEAGVIRTRAGEPISERLEKIYRGLEEVILEHRPKVLCLEKLYSHYKHPTTALLMGHARGVVCLLSGIHKIALVNYASTHVKKAVTGAGHAKKFQVQRAVQEILSLKELPEPPDVADALAVAIAYVSMKGRAITK